MTKFDEAEVKRAISKIKALRRPTRGPLVQRAPISKHRLAAAKMLEVTLAKAGLDVAKFNKLMEQDRRAARDFIKKARSSLQRRFEQQQKPDTDSALKNTLSWES